MKVLIRNGSCIDGKGNPPRKQDVLIIDDRIASISDATGSFYSLIPQDNSAGNFVKVEQRIPVRIEFTENNSEENLQRLRAGMNVECYVQSE